MSLRVCKMIFSLKYYYYTIKRKGSRVPERQILHSALVWMFCSHGQRALHFSCLSLLNCEMMTTTAALVSGKADALTVPSVFYTQDVRKFKTLLRHHLFCLLCTYYSMLANIRFSPLGGD